MPFVQVCVVTTLGPKGPGASGPLLARIEVQCRNFLTCDFAVSPRRECLTVLPTSSVAQALKTTGKWSMQELESLWSETALTAAVLPRWHIDQSIKRNLGVRLGSLKQAA